MSRKTQVAALVAILFGVAAAWWIRRPPEGFLTGVAPVDGTRSIFTMRANYADAPSRAWIGLLDAEADEVVWWRELPGETYSIFARHGLTVSENQVTVKVHDTEDTTRVLAFDLTTGEERWRSDAIELRPTEPPALLPFVSGERPHDDGRQVFHGDHDRAAARLVARDAATGATQWSHELPSHGVHDILFAPSAVLVRREAWKVLDRSGGAVAHEIDVHGDGCIDAEGRFVTWHDDTLVRIDLADLAAKPERHPLPSEGDVRACGTHGDRIVFTVAGRSDDLEDRRFAMIAVSGDAPAVEWRVDLGQWEPSPSAHDRDNSDVDAVPNRGRLADFVPLVLTAHDVDALKLVVVDVENGAIAWEGRPQADLLFYQLYRGSGSQHFLSSGSRIIALDGDSGDVTAAVDVVHQTSTAFHARDGRLWIHSMDWQRMDDLPWAVLDGRTLAVVARGNDELQPVDTTQETVAWLGANQPR